MTDQQKDHLVAAGMGIVSVNTNGILYQTKDGLSHNCPPFGECLNAMHEAENALTDSQWLDYDLNLECVTKCNGFIQRKRINATASQRREAYLRTLNLLKE